MSVRHCKYGFVAAKYFLFFCPMSPLNQDEKTFNVFTCPMSPLNQGVKTFNASTCPTYSITVSSFIGEYILWNVSRSTLTTSHALFSTISPAKRVLDFFFFFFFQLRTSIARPSRENLTRTLPSVDITGLFWRACCQIVMTGPTHLLALGNPNAIGSQQALEKRAFRDVRLETEVHRQTERQTERQTHRHRHRHTRMHACMQTYRHRHMHTPVSYTHLTLPTIDDV